MPEVQTENERNPDNTRALIFCLLLAALVHLPNLFTYFYMDDFWHLDFALSRDDYIFSTWTVEREEMDEVWFMSKKIFTSLADYDRIEYYFRPVFLLSIYLDHALFDFNALGYHAQNLLWHLFAVWLFYLLASALGLKRKERLLATLVFGIHPAMAEPVGWVSARADLQATAFLLASAFFYLRFRREKKSKPLYFAAHLVFFLLALGSKEQAAIFPFLLVAVELFSVFRLKAEARRFPLALLPAMGFASAFLLWRISASATGEGVFSLPESNFKVFLAYGALSVLGANIGYYLQTLALGLAGISFILRDAPLTGVMTWPLFALFFPLVLWWLARLKSPALAFAFFWAFGFTASVLWMPPSPRYLYTPMVGFSLLFAIYAMRAIEPLTRTKWRKVLSGGIAALFVVWGSVSFLWALNSVFAHEATKQGVETIRKELRENPAIERVYLLHLWPPMISMNSAIEHMAGRAGVEIRLLTFRSSLHNETFHPLHEKIGLWAHRIPRAHAQPLRIETKQTGEKSLLVKSEPLGFFAGPGAFGWKITDIPDFAGKSVQLGDMRIKLAPYSKKKGIRSILFEFNHALKSEDVLFLQWKAGKLQRWQPSRSE